MTIFDFFTVFMIVTTQTLVADFIGVKLGSRMNKLLAQLLGQLLAFIIVIGVILGYHYVK